MTQTESIPLEVARPRTVSREALVQAAFTGDHPELPRSKPFQCGTRATAFRWRMSASACGPRPESTYKELLQKHRMETAARLLRRSDLNIQQIITQVGYENTSYFYRLFHERYGQSPREYRRARSQRT